MLYSVRLRLIWVPGHTFFSEVCMTPAACLVTAQVDICCEGTGHTHRPFSFNFKILASTRCWHQFWCEPLQYPPISSLHLICPRSIRIKQVVSGNKSISHLHFLTMPSTLLFDKRSQCNFYLEGGAWGDFTGLDNDIHCSIPVSLHSQPLRVSASRYCPCDCINDIYA